MTVVGIGASAGGLVAIRALLASVPSGNGLAWVVVVHMPPDHDSHLASLLERHTHMPVEQVTGTVRIRGDHVYVIPPGSNLDVVDGDLRVSRGEPRAADRSPIDYFLRALAHGHDGDVVAVILTGTGSDGTLGVRAIKERRGLVVAQDPNEAQYDAMPRSAISTGVVDRILAAADIPAAILRYTGTEPRVNLPAEGEAPGGTEATLLNEILAAVRARTGQDFTRYKPPTLLRRIARRMQRLEIAEPDAYLARLHHESGEGEALAAELLVPVTRFFRDPEVFEQLASTVVPALFESRSADEPVRAWSVGCATGEEAYSLAMLLLEEQERRRDGRTIQVFATDLHAPSLAIAREGFYSGDIRGDIGAERLARFFVPARGGYRIRKSVRDHIVFATHDLLSDPPFSRLDVVTCRNLLIYLERGAQADVMDLLHYTLRPGGVLVVGSAEHVDTRDLFRSTPGRNGIWVRGEPAGPEVRLPVFVRAGRRGERTGRPSLARHASPAGVQHRRMLERHGPPSVLIGQDDEVLHLSDGVGRYLQQPGGELTLDVHQLVREELRVELRRSLRRARGRGAATHSDPVLVDIGNDPVTVVLSVRPALDDDPSGHVLVLFDEWDTPSTRSPPDVRATDPARVAELESALSRVRRELLSLSAEYEGDLRELGAANEEAQSSNEELRSTLQELDTSREQILSVNQELGAVNAENRQRVEELYRLSVDLENLMAATEIATLFVDTEGRILRFTPKARELFNIRTTDRGRPLAHFTHRLGHAGLTEDAARVQATGEAIDREVRDIAGRAYLLRVLPYRATADGAIDGVGITLTDITDRKEMEDSLRESMRQAESASVAKSQFLSVMSHELRTPLSAVIGLADLIETGVAGPVNERQKAHLARIKSSAWHLVTIIDGILSFTRAEAGGEQVEAADVDVAEIASAVVEMLQPEATRRDCTLRLPEPTAQAHARTDGAKVRQIVTNLVGNALKYGGDAVDVGVASDERWIEVSVHDRGPGIAADQLEAIFEPFVQADSSRTRQAGGTGLGLAICRRLARLLGGEVTVDSEPGIGSTFTLRLPRNAR